MKYTIVLLIIAILVIQIQSTNTCVNEDQFFDGMKHFDERYGWGGRKLSLLKNGIIDFNFHEYNIVVGNYDVNDFNIPAPNENFLLRFQIRPSHFDVNDPKSKHLFSNTGDHSFNINYIQEDKHIYAQIRHGKAYYKQQESVKLHFYLDDDFLEKYEVGQYISIALYVSQTSARLYVQDKLRDSIDFQYKWNVNLLQKTRHFAINKYEQNLAQQSWTPWYHNKNMEMIDLAVFNDVSDDQIYCINSLQEQEEIQKQ